ncbi:hypothetical protein F4780DRAFT_776316 [Xylariomycetidae sp. FL0641]|nr:hypothetical protein F4780DRAFT_776316 [Xylariomycetidae sp. FL0641]
MASEFAAAAARQVEKELHGVVVSAGRMDKTIKVKLGGMRWEDRVQKHFKAPYHRLVHDPRNSVRQGDIVSIAPSWRASQHVRHVVKAIIAPFGEPIESRRPVPTLAERVAERVARREAKDARRSLRRAVDSTVLAAVRLAADARRALLAAGVPAPALPVPEEATTHAAATKDRRGNRKGKRKGKKAPAATEPKPVHPDEMDVD